MWDRHGPGAVPGLAFFYLLFLLAACSPVKAPVPPPPGNAAAVSVKPAYATEAEKLNAGIEHGLTLIGKQPGDTLLPLEVVSLYQERARLTGDYENYAKAEALLAGVPAASPPSASLCFARARLHYTLHRIKSARAALDTCPANADSAELAALHSDIALYSGRYRAAEEGYRALVNGVGTPAHYVRLGLLKKWLGSPGEAAAFIEAAEKRYHAGAPVMLAWLKLQRGLIALDRGRLDEALALYWLASDALGGWWLIDEHIAEVLHLSGKTQEARKMYEDIVARTGNPEFMDALAAIERELGHADAAKRLTQQARAIYEKWLAAFPEAAAGHALEHFLQDAADAKYALTLAQKNFDTRPYGESDITLAKAWMLNGKADRAVPLIEAQLANGWDTAEAYWVLGEAMAQSGVPQGAQKAQQAKAEALRRNPRSEKMYAYAPLIGAPKSSGPRQ